MNYKEVLERFSSVGEAYVVVNLFEIYIGTQKIKIKVEKDLRNGKCSYTNNHHYHGSNQATPYTSSGCVMIDSETEALSSALRELTSFYDENDANAEWVVNEYF